MPKLELGNGVWAAKLCFDNVPQRGAIALSAALPKQSFGDECVPKLELGNEEADAHAPTQRRGYRTERG